MLEASVSPLRRRMIEDMTIRNLAPKTTQQGYIQDLCRVPRPLPDTASFEAMNGGCGSRVGRPLRESSRWGSSGCRCSWLPGWQPILPRKLRRSCAKSDRSAAKLHQSCPKVAHPLHRAAADLSSDDPLGAQAYR